MDDGLLVMMCSGIQEPLLSMLEVCRQPYSDGEVMDWGEAKADFTDGDCAAACRRLPRRSGMHGWARHRDIGVIPGPLDATPARGPAGETL